MPALGASDWERADAVARLVPGVDPDASVRLEYGDGVPVAHPATQ